MNSPYKTLIDTNILMHRWTHQTEMKVWRERWGELDVEIPIARDIPKQKFDESQKWLQTELNALPHVISLVKDGVVSLFSSFELKSESMGLSTRPSLDSEYDLFKGVKIGTVPPPYNRTVVWSGDEESFVTNKKEKEAFLRDIKNERFRSLDQLTQGNKQADVFHVITAEYSNLDCFLTLDRKFLKAINGQKKVSLRVEVLSPSELVAKFRKP